VRGHRDLERLLVAAVAAALIAMLVPWEPLRIVAGVPLALVLTGYAIVAAAFGPRRPDWPLRAVMIVASSIAVLAIGTLFLNYMPGGIRGVSWAVLLVLVTVAASSLAAHRRQQPQPARAPHAPRRLGRLEIALFGGAVLATVAALVLAQATLSASGAVGYTALWMTRGGAAGRQLTIGVASSEQHPVSYRLVAGVGLSGQVVERFSLDPGQEVEFRLTVRGPPHGRPARVFASLFRSAAPRSLYRRVTSWVPGAAKIE
jgi:Protein of unknown function (DUF1616)